MAKQIWVNLREARLFQQWLNSNVASATWENMLVFVKDDMKVILKAKEELEKSELFTKVWGEIEKEAERIVKEKCQPEWNRISEQMKPLGEKRNELAKKKASTEVGSAWWEEDEKELADLDKQLSDLSAEYQKVTDEANAELNEFKEKRINEEQWACFFLSEKDYKIIWGYAGF